MEATESTQTATYRIKSARPLLFPTIRFIFKDQMLAKEHYTAQGIALTNLLIWFQDDAGDDENEFSSRADWLDSEFGIDYSKIVNAFWDRMEEMGGYDLITDALSAACADLGYGGGTPIEADPLPDNVETVEDVDANLTAAFAENENDF